MRLTENNLQDPGFAFLFVDQDTFSTLFYQPRGEVAAPACEV